MSKRDRRTGKLAFRVCVALVSGFLATAALSSAIVGATRQKNYDMALRFNAGDADALSKKADVKLANAKSPSDLVEISVLARKSLLAQAANARALRLLGYGFDSTAQHEKAESLVSLASRLSRRDFGTGLYLIESNIQKGNISSTLNQYDIALRTSLEGRSILFPVLIRALEDTDIRKGFGRFIKSNPPWLIDFLSQAIATGDHPEFVSQAVIAAGGLPREQSFQDLETQLLLHLSAKRKYGELGRFYSTLPGASADVLTSPEFNRAATDPLRAPAAWEILDTAGANATFETLDQGGRSVLQILAESGTRTTIARKLLLLTPGLYRFEAKASFQPPAGGSSASFILQCWHNGILTSTNSQEIRTLRPAVTVAWDLNVKADCPSQVVLLLVSGGTSRDGSELTINRFKVQKVL